VTAVSRTTFVNAQPVGRSVIVVNQQEIASAPINRRAEVAPTRNSVLGPSAASGQRASQPPAAVVSRVVVAKTAPPPAPVPFEKQQAKLAAQPGQPLARNEVEVLRPPNASPARTHFKQAPQGKPAQADSTEPVARPANNIPGGRGGNRGQQPVTAQPQVPVPAAAVTTPPANNAPASRGGNRPPQPANAQPPTTVTPPAPAVEAPVGRGGNGGQNRGNAGTPDTSKTPASPAPPANNGQGGRGGNGGQTRGNSQTPEQEPNSIVPIPAPSNGRGNNRGQQNP
jgi:hypothetical protein